MLSWRQLPLDGCGGGAGAQCQWPRGLEQLALRWFRDNGWEIRFSQDYVFSSPSTAAAVVLGRSANGRVEWKDSQGRMLKQLQGMEARS
jgi:hypothetical protein